jgi:hypothetical protein
MATKTEIENAILEATGNPDSGTIRDNLGVMVDAVLRVVAPDAVPAVAAKTNKETRIVETKETR